MMLKNDHHAVFAIAIAFIPYGAFCTIISAASEAQEVSKGRSLGLTAKIDKVGLLFPR